MAATSRTEGRVLGLSRIIRFLVVALFLAMVSASTATSAAVGFHNPSNVAAHIQRSLNKQLILRNVSGRVRCTGTARVVACIGDLRTGGLSAHNSWRYTYISPQRARVVIRVEDMDGSLLAKQTDFVRPQRYGLSSF
jgi:hypothetical protein